MAAILPHDFDEIVNKENMIRGDLYWAFSPALIADRARCTKAWNDFNNAGMSLTRRERLELWNKVVDNNNSLPLPALTQQEDELLLRHKPWIEPPLKMDYPYNLTLGTNVFINSSCTILNPCMVTIGSRTLIGPNVSFYGGVHPLDPAIRNGTDGPQAGREIEVGEDCWIGGHVVILAGVKIGRGSTVGAGSMVTRDVPEMVVVAGNPAKVIEKSTMRMRKQAKQNAGDGQKEKGSENLLTDGRTRFWRLWNIGKGRAVAWTDKKTLESDINPKH